MTIIDVILNIILSLCSSQIYDGKTKLLDKIRIKLFCSKLVRWSRRYIKSHDDSILTRKDFERFVKDYKLFENLFSQIVSGDTCKSKENFISEQIKLFHSMQTYPEKNEVDTDEILKEFICYFYDKFDVYCRKHLSQNQKYMLAKSEIMSKQTIEAVKNSQDSINDNVNNGFNDLKKVLESQNSIGDTEKIWNIYKLMATTIVNGKISEILPLVPLLPGKSEDLENGIAYLLGLFSCKKEYFADLKQIERVIKDQRIYDDICRITIYLNLWRNNIDAIAKIKYRNQDIRNIARSLEANFYEDFFTIEEKRENGITYYMYNVTNGYPNEQWLVNRIITLKTLQTPAVNVSDIFESLMKNSDNLLDRILLLGCRLTELYNKQDIDLDKAKELYLDIVQLSSFTQEIAIDFQEKIYTMLIKAALLISDDEAEIAIDKVPQWLYGCKDIDLLICEVRMRKGSDTEGEVISLCMKYDEYWPFYDYLLASVDKNPKRVKELIEKYAFILDKDPAICFLYVQILNNLVDTQTALEFLHKYQMQYGVYLEFWIHKMRIMYDEMELSRVIKNYKEGELKHLTKRGVVDFAKLLIHRNKSEAALDIINECELMGNTTPELTKCKAVSFCNLKREIEALAIFKKLFEGGDCSEQVVYYILALSCNNHRQVPKSVCICAENSDNVQILMLIAQIYATKGNLDKAYFLNIKAMLRTKDDYREVFGQYLGLERFEEYSEESHIASVNDDTVLYLNSIDGLQKQVYVIHSKHLLIDEPCVWDGATHIYKETAIKLKLFRKRVGEIVTINNEQYKIKSIEPLKHYFYRLSMSKVIEDGNAKEFSIPMSDDENVDKEKLTELLKQFIDDDVEQLTWFRQYQDFSQLPLTFFMYKKFVRCTYFQLVNDMIEASDIIYRESVTKNAIDKENTIISYSALIALYKLGWSTLEPNDKFTISQSLRNMISDEKESVIRENNREHVSYLGVKNAEVYVHENSECEKNQYISNIVEFESYCDSFRTIDNYKDLQFTDAEHIDIKEILGIADYDSMIIAQNDNRVFVSAESLISGIAQMPEVNVKVVCIAEFLTSITQNADELLGYIHRMVEFKFTVPFTFQTIYKLGMCFDEGDEESRKVLYERWKYILEIPLKDEKYKNTLLPIIQDCVVNFQEGEIKINPIWSCLITYGLKYSGQEIQLYSNEDGELCIEIVKF